MSKIITPGQAHAEVEQVPDPTSFLRAAAVDRFQRSLDSSAASIAIVAAILLGHRADLSAFASPRPAPINGDEQAVKWVQGQNRDDRASREQFSRKLEGAISLARAVVILAHDAALPQEPRGPETGDEPLSQAIDEDVTQEIPTEISA